MGNGGCSQFIMCCFCHSFLLRGGSFPCSHVGCLLQGTSSTIFFNSFMWAAILHELFQCGSLPWHTLLQEQVPPVWTQVLPANVNVPQHGLLSPQGHMSCQEPTPAWASQGITAFWGSRGCRGTATSPWAAPWAVRESLFWCLEYLRIWWSLCTCAVLNKFVHGKTW